MTKEQREEALKIKLSAMLENERSLWSSGIDLIAGVDEVGRGPLAGPVVTAAVILPKDFSLLGVDDSKKLSPKKRDMLFDQIKEAAVCWAVARREPAVIDEINILEATRQAMEESVLSLSPRPQHVLVDAVRLKNLEIPQTPIIHGDALSASIAAASIIAKVTRDREMEQMAKIWPGYSFENNKGYGTKAHYEGLARLGPCPIHRKTFL